jgi:hypothetical protein
MMRSRLRDVPDVQRRRIHCLADAAEVDLRVRQCRLRGGNTLARRKPTSIKHNGHGRLPASQTPRVR